MCVCVTKSMKSFCNVQTKLDISTLLDIRSDIRIITKAGCTKANFISGPPLISREKVFRLHLIL